jgi:hypothetical protein
VKPRRTRGAGGCAACCRRTVKHPSQRLDLCCWLPGGSRQATVWPKKPQVPPWGAQSVATPTARTAGLPSLPGHFIPATGCHTHAPVRTAPAFLPLRDRVATVSVSRNRVSYSPNLPRFLSLVPPSSSRVSGSPLRSRLLRALSGRLRLIAWVLDPTPLKVSSAKDSKNARLLRPNIIAYRNTTASYTRHSALWGLHLHA